MIWKNLGFDLGVQVTPENYFKIIDDGIDSLSFRIFIGKLTSTLISSDDKQIRTGLKKDFCKDILCLLKDISYPYDCDLLVFENKLCLIETMVSEFEAKRMLSCNTEDLMETESKNCLNPKFKSSEIVYKMCSLFDIIPIQDNRENIGKITTKLVECLSKLPKNYLGKPVILSQNYTSSQFVLLDEMNKTLKQEYGQRKKVLLKRLDVTLQSFLWSEKGEQYIHDLNSLISQKKTSMNLETNIDVYDIFTIHTDALRIVKTGSQELTIDSKSSIRATVYGVLPIDRGGRILERRIDMPVFKPRVAESVSQSKSQMNPNKKPRVQDKFQGDDQQAYKARKS